MAREIPMALDQALARPTVLKLTRLHTKATTSLPSNERSTGASADVKLYHKAFPTTSLHKSVHIQGIGRTYTTKSLPTLVLLEARFRRSVAIHCNHILPCSMRISHSSRLRPTLSVLERIAASAPTSHHSPRVARHQSRQARHLIEHSETSNMTAVDCRDLLSPL